MWRNADWGFLVLRSRPAQRPATRGIIAARKTAHAVAESLTPAAREQRRQVRQMAMFEAHKRSTVPFTNALTTPPADRGERELDVITEACESIPGSFFSQLDKEQRLLLYQTIRLVEVNRGDEIVV